MFYSAFLFLSLILFTYKYIKEWQLVLMHYTLRKNGHLYIVLFLHMICKGNFNICGFKFFSKTNDLDSYGFGLSLKAHFCFLNLLILSFWFSFLNRKTGFNALNSKEIWSSLNCEKKHMICEGNFWFSFEERWVNLLILAHIIFN